MVESQIFLGWGSFSSTFWTTLHSILNIWSHYRYYFPVGLQDSPPGWLWFPHHIELSVQLQVLMLSCLQMTLSRVCQLYTPQYNPQNAKAVSLQTIKGNTYTAFTQFRITIQLLPFNVIYLSNRTDCTMRRLTNVLNYVTYSQDYMFTSTF